MNIINIEQGSDAWFQHRLQRITGTQFSALMSKKTTIGYKNLISEIAGEIIANDSNEFEPDSFQNDTMQRGTDYEKYAREMYADIFEPVDEIGMCIPDENNEFHNWIGVSPDGITAHGGIEIKCPLRKTHISYITNDKLPNEYFWQVHAQLFVTELPYVDFISYYPNMKLFVKRVWRDDAVIEQIEQRLRETVELIIDEINKYNSYLIKITDKQQTT